jgi:hypothetical protein
MKRRKKKTTIKLLKEFNFEISTDIFFDRHQHSIENGHQRLTPEGIGQEKGRSSILSHKWLLER